MRDNKHAQMKYLKDRLESVARRKNVFWGDHAKVKISKPAEVRAAETRIKADSKIVARFEQKIDTATKRRNEQRKAAYEACRKEVFFGDSRKALRMLDQFEAKW